VVISPDQPKDDFERARNLRNEAEQRGITLKRGEEDKPHYHFDLNLGAMKTSKDPQKALELVQLAVEQSAPGFGEHKALLGQVAKLKELEQDTVTWHDPFAVEAEKNPKVWVSLEDWLNEQGLNVSELEEGK